MSGSPVNAPPVKGSVFEWRLIRRLLGYMRPYRLFFLLALITTLSLSILAPAQPWLIQRLLDGPVPAGDASAVRMGILFILGLLLFNAGIQYLNAYLTGWLGQSVVRDIRTQVFRHITGLKLRVFDTTPVGTLQTRTISDVETLNDVFSEGFVSILGEILQMFAILVIMLVISWKLTLVVMTTVPMMLFATWVFKNAVKNSFQGVRKYVALMNAFLQEHITGMNVIHIFNREDEEYKRFDELNQRHTEANLNGVLAYSIFFPVVEIFSALATALIVWYGTGQVLAEQISFGVLVAFIMYVGMFFRPLRMLADRFNTLQMGMVSAERIFTVLDIAADKEDSGPDTQVPAQAAGVSVAFDKVWFAYKEQEYVIRDLSFSLEPGQKLAIVGATGSGKSTIINLLTRFYEIERGKITVNGSDIADLNLQSLRETVGLVLQDVFLFSGTILENITLGHPGISREQAMEAARLVGADNFIQKLPGGYDWQVQERGATLSSGQRQLISFARVLAFNPQLLILDEATSNIDTESEELIQEAIDTVMKGRTSIIIAHRLSTIQKANQILVLAKGEIQERGTHQELLALNGAYRKLYDLQFAGV